jgi:16S rRNA (guanine966-N2)-methyltransferase
MKITGGKFKGRQLKYPKNIRPTSDKVREAIFGALQDRVVGAKVLDLYAGSGALGFEALSRGAGLVAIVENSPSSLASIKKNDTILDAHTEIIFGDVTAFIGKEERTFDLIFADPPYEEIDWQTIDRAAKLLNFDGLLVVEHASRTELPGLENLYERESKRYGDTTITYLANKPSKAA